MRRHALLLALTLSLPFPTSLVAQSQASSDPRDGVMLAFETFASIFGSRLVAAFDSIPAARYDYRPTPVQQSIGYIAQHLASDNYLFCNNFGPMKAMLSAKDTTTADSIKAQWPKDTLVAKLKASLGFCEAAFAQLNDSKLGDPIEMTFNGMKRNSTRVTMVLGHALDMADHYSQLSNYMRLNNILPPTALPRPGRGGGGD